MEHRNNKETHILLIYYTNIIQYKISFVKSILKIILGFLIGDLDYIYYTIITSQSQVILFIKFFEKI